MKKFFIILFVFGLISCNQKEDPIKEKVISAVKSKMKNPDSFEFVSYEKFKEVNFKDAKIGLPLIKELIRISTGTEKINYQKKIDFINSETDDNKIAYYVFYLTVKGTNSFGAIVQSKYAVEVLNNENKDIMLIKEK